VLIIVHRTSYLEQMLFLPHLLNRSFGCSFPDRFTWHFEGLALFVYRGCASKRARLTHRGQPRPSADGVTRDSRALLPLPLTILPGTASSRPEIVLASPYRLVFDVGGVKRHLILPLANWRAERAVKKKLGNI
jgi:hypothetical protein